MERDISFVAHETMGITIQSIFFHSLSLSISLFLYVAEEESQLAFLFDWNKLELAPDRA